MMSATASSEAVSVSMRNVRGTGASIADALQTARTAIFTRPSDLWVAAKKSTVTRFPREHTMFTPPSLTIALLMMITSAICWGSWANTYKGVKNYRFELFYWDYAVGIFLISLILAFTMGSTGHDSTSFLNNVQSADTNNIVSVMVGGAI